MCVTAITKFLLLNLGGSLSTVLKSKLIFTFSGPNPGHNAMSSCDAEMIFSKD